MIPIFCVRNMALGVRLLQIAEVGNLQGVKRPVWSVGRVHGVPLGLDRITNMSVAENMKHRASSWIGCKSMYR